MKLLSYAVILSLSILLMGCRNNDPLASRLLILDIKKAIDNKQPFSLDEITDKIEFIPLGNDNQESLVGDIREIQESKSGFHIMDSPINPVKIFDKTGKFIFTIGSIGRGPNEYLFAGGIVVNPSTDETYVLTRPKGVIAYTSTGRVFARNDQIPDGKISYYENRLFVLKDPSDPLPEIGDTISIASIYFPDLRHESDVNAIYLGHSYARVGSEGTGTSARFIGHFVSNNGERVLMKLGRNDTLYLLKNNGSYEPSYKLEMGNYSPPAEMFEGISSLAEWGKYYSVEQIFEGEKYIVGEVENGAFGAHDFLIFEKNHLSGGFTATGSDGRSGLFINGIRFTPCYVRDNRLIGYMQAIDIVDNAAAITHPGVKTLAATLKEDSNPVIVVAELKK